LRLASVEKVMMQPAKRQQVSQSIVALDASFDDVVWVSSIGAATQLRPEFPLRTHNLLAPASASL